MYLGQNPEKGWASIQHRQKNQTPQNLWVGFVANFQEKLQSRTQNTGRAGEIPHILPISASMLLNLS